MTGLGPFSIQTVAVAAAMGVAWLVARYLLRSTDTTSRRTAASTLLDALFVGLFAARVAYVLRWWPEYFATPLSIIAIGDGGFNVWAGLPAALAVVGLAALVAVFAVRGPGRLVVAGLLAVSGLGAGLSAWAGASDSDALNEKAAQTTGNTATTVDALSHTVWPYLTAAGGLLILLAGLLALRYGRRWPAMSGRYERDGTPRPRKAPRTAPDPDRPEDLWKALDRGEDPTREV